MRVQVWINGREAMVGWAGLMAGVLVYEIVAPPGQLLSEGVDRALLRYPNLTRAVVLMVALHLINLLPQHVDPLNRVASLRGVTMRGRRENRSAWHTGPGTGPTA